MSQRPVFGCGRGRPRWSRGNGHSAFGIAFFAGLVLLIGIVAVGPPCAPSRPSIAGSPILSVPMTAKVQPSVLATRFRPAEATVWEQFGPSGAAFSARIDASRVVVPDS